MKRLFILFFILLASSVHARSTCVVTGFGVSGGASPTYLFSESFEGASDCSSLETDSNCSNGWTRSSGSSTPDFTVTASPLEGTNSMTPGSGNGMRNTTNFSTASPIYAFGMFNVATYTAGTANIAYLADASGNSCALALRNSTGAKLCVAFAGDLDCDTAATNGQTYYWWLEFTKGASSNASCNLYLSTTSTKPETATSTLTGKTADWDMVRISLIDNATYTSGIVFDKIRVDDAVIGSNPQ